MGLLSKLNAAVFNVPLVLSSMLLRMLGPLLRGRRRPPPRQHARLQRPAPAPAAIDTADASPAPAKKVDAKAMRRELTAVLDAHDGSREVFRYLAHFERRFAHGGMKTLDDMPVQRLRRALAQFEAIVTNWSSPQLAELRSRMAVVVTARDSGSTMWVPAHTISKAYGPRDMPMVGRPAHKPAAAKSVDFQASRQVEVDDDISLSRFEAAFGEWQPSQQSALAATMKAPAAGS